MKYISFGDISTTRYWLSFERRPLAWWRWFVSFGPTYCGTTHGLVIGLPCVVVIGHIRDLNWKGE